MGTRGLAIGSAHHTMQPVMLPCFDLELWELHKSRSNGSTCTGYLGSLYVADEGIVRCMLVSRRSSPDPDRLGDTR